ncbi:MAG TPA: galactose-1-phosphate uridylyltransferase [Candidatus Dormibacteraeota bacterium]|nr:galactose-1-phosphate uridylyltransferase [Candidatus Dormibacteraeota bacterium]
MGEGGDGSVGGRLGRRVLVKPDGRYLLLFEPGGSRQGRVPEEASRSRGAGELRWHPLLREWVTVAPWRQERTYHPPPEHCPLCPTRPGGLETEIPLPDYHIAVFENRFPAYAGRQGRCEVVCYTSAHRTSLGAQSVDHARDLVEVWRDRVEDLSRSPGVRYVYVFENRGEVIGVTLHHPHGQIYGYPFVPPVIERELASSAAYLRRTRRCLYCDLLAEEIGGPRTVAGDGRWLAFVPPFARWPYEVHLAPLAHAGGLTELGPEESDSLARVLIDLLRRYDRLFRRPLPYVMAMHQRPPGRGGSHYHLHIEFYPPNRSADRLKYLAGSELGAGAFLVDARAEDTARELRGLG